MSLEFLAPVTALTAIEPAQLPALSQTEAPVAGFSSWFSKEVGAVNDRLVDSDHEIQKLATGSEQSLHEVMIHLEEARLSFQLLVQVRNRLLEAYQEVMRMQV